MGLHHMKTYKNLYTQVCDFSTLHTAYKKAKRLKRYRGEVLVYKVRPWKPEKHCLVSVVKLKHKPHTIRLLAELRGKLYYISGQFKQTARLPPRRQLEQHDECRSVRPESEQCADEYQYQHWVPRRQELWLQHLVYKVRPCKKGWLEWPLTKVSAREQTKDLPFELSVPAGFIPIWLNRIVPGGYPKLRDFARDGRA